jgi:catechol 2,3-dioxygenase-like lactoylglutathione lyase family enzyme
MIHVPDVRATVEWYRSIGFTLVRENVEDGNMNWALLKFGNSEVMFDICGKPSTERRREVDLYITVDNVDDLYRRGKERIPIVVELYDAIYGMREFIIRDFNGFWITFGQPIEAP